MILVTGATGLNGKELVRQLSARGIALRALVRNVAKAAELSSLPNVEIVVGDMAHAHTLPEALRGVDRAMLISSSEPAMLEIQTNFIAAAANAGVQHVVKLSGIMPELDSPFRFARMHGEIERRLEASGMAFTHLRAGEFMPSYFRQVPSIIAKGALFLPMENAKIASIDIGDIAEVAATVLTNPGHEGKIYDRSGGAQHGGGCREALRGHRQENPICQRRSRCGEERPVGRGSTAIHRRCLGRALRRAAQGQGVAGFSHGAGDTRTPADEL
jgi:uncharacterized protein YbjT (DUF2867 family)